MPAAIKTIFPELPMLRILLCLSFLLLLPAQLPAIPKSEQELARITDKLTQTSVTYGSIPSLYRPQYTQVVNAALSLGKDETVFVVRLPDGYRIYPQRIMVWHQVVNELIDDHAYVITYCPISGCLAAYNASMDGINLIFDIEGRLFEGNSILMDRNSGSLWVQMLGMAFDGPLRGRGMPMLPTFWTSWNYASRAFPDAQVLIPPLESKKAYGRDPYGNYQRRDSYYQNDILIYPVSRLDRRFHRKTPMLGLEYDNLRISIEIPYVKQNGAVNFFMGDKALVAVHDMRIGAVRIFDRQIWEKPALFFRESGRLMDLDTRSYWSDEGKCVEGNLQGAAMRELFGIYAMWFAWFAMNPETLILPGPGEVDKALLEHSPPGQVP
jgi:hypothetical protein